MVAVDRLVRRVARVPLSALQVALDVSRQPFSNFLGEVEVDVRLIVADGCQVFQERFGALSCRLIATPTGNFPHLVDCVVEVAEHPSLVGETLVQGGEELGDDGLEMSIAITFCGQVGIRQLHDLLNLVGQEFMGGSQNTLCHEGTGLIVVIGHSEQVQGFTDGAGELVLGQVEYTWPATDDVLNRGLQPVVVRQVVVPLEFCQRLAEVLVLDQVESRLANHLDIGVEHMLPGQVDDLAFVAEFAGRHPDRNHVVVLISLHD